MRIFLTILLVSVFLGLDLGVAAHDEQQNYPEVIKKDQTAAYGRRSLIGIDPRSYYYQYLQDWNIRNDQNQKAILKTLQQIEQRLERLENQEN